MNRSYAFLILTFSIPLIARAQITVTSEQLGLGEGGQRDYATHLSETVSVDGLIQFSGFRQWDFTEGPSDEMFRHVVMTKDESGVGHLFPGAELAERGQFDSADEPGWSFYRLPENGRELHGFFDEGINPAQPEVVFSNAVIDFPGTMNFEDEWSSSFSYDTALDLDELGIFDVKVDVSLDSVVDAYGTLTLPPFGDIPVLRINELTTQASTTTVEGMPVNLGFQYIRSYYWISDQLGIVAQITSEAATELPPEVFPTAARFMRLRSRTTEPSAPELNLEIVVAGGIVTLTWDSVEGVDSYEVYASPDMADGNWEKLATVSSTRFLDAVSGLRRYYKLGVGS